MQASSALSLQHSSRDACTSVVQDQQNIQPDFDEFYRLWFHDVCRWARALGGLRADVEDIAQDVFLVVRRKFDQFDGQHPKAWLYKITQRAVRDYRRRAWWRLTIRPAAEFLNQIVDPADGPRKIVQLKEAEQRVAGILDRMSLVRRSAFILHEIEGYSGEEIAQLEGIPVSTVYTRLHHARKEFFRRLSRQIDKQERDV